jgi:hypothetical protein|tara:strand:+ start:539 stop:1402 length:864 start_codon:yes stop_codon:yes gene_type:complete
MDEEKKNKFKERELELKNSDDFSGMCVSYCDLADEIRDENDLDWAKNLYIEAIKYVEFGSEWWDDFGCRLIDTELLDSKNVGVLFDKWEINVKENRGNLSYVEKDELYRDLLNYLETKTDDKERIIKINLEWENSYTINELEGPFGTSRQGDGKFVYLFTNKLDLSAVNLVVSTHYHKFVKDENGNIVRDLTEYDPSHLDTEIIGTIEDEISFLEVINKISKDNSDLEKIKFFIRKEILEKNIPLIFIDSEEKVISQLNDEDIDSVIEKYKDALNIFIREYDQAGDY